MTVLSPGQYLHHATVQTAHFYQAVQVYRDVLGTVVLVHGVPARPRRRGGRDSRALYGATLTPSECT
jgi:hypothetical protein